MLRISSLSVPAGSDGEAAVRRCAERALGAKKGEVLSVRIKKRSVDARKKGDVRIIYTVDAGVTGDEKRFLSPKRANVSRAVEYIYRVPTPAALPERRPVVVGFGPAGMFAALVLAKAGLRPVVLERGGSVDERKAAVEDFWSGGKLDPECNVQFGEGGAGAFSDGKLNTGTGNERIAWVLSQLHRFGAPERITYDAKPHVGTDVLQKVVKKLREEVVSLGGELHFRTKMTGICTGAGGVAGVEVSGPDGTPEYIACDRLILAPGHSARDTFEALCAMGITMEPKAFSMGVRIEHRQSDIDSTQYGKFAGCRALGAADYKLSCRLADGSSAYTFCMCPGGYVVAASSEEGGVVTNGMSYSGRGGENANSALLVTLTPQDFPDKSSPLGGMYWQREIEQRAFRVGGGSYLAPCESVGSFLGLAEPEECVLPTYRPGVCRCSLREVLPEQICGTISAALPELDKKLPGFASPSAVMTAPETRSSSPVRIMRGEDRQSTALRGLYPCGEGAGYAGGIVSAAVDGILTAEALIASL